MWVLAAAALVLVGGSAIAVDASSSGADGSVLVPTVPTRVLDTRVPGAQFDTLGASGVGTLDFTGVIPADARAVDLNMTITDGTQPSFLTVWPTGGDKPNSSVLNWLDASPDANAVSIQLGTGQAIDIGNEFGTVNVVVDMMGYYIPSPSGGEPGPAGPPGVAAIQVVTAKKDVTGGAMFDVIANCPSGKSVLSGGFDLSDAGFDLDEALSSGPSGTTGWRVAGTTLAAQTVTVSALCATVAP